MIRQVLQFNDEEFKMKNENTFNKYMQKYLNVYLDKFLNSIKSSLNQQPI